VTAGKDDLVILHDDAEMLAVAKPAGLLSYPPTKGRERNLVDVVRAHNATRGEACHPVHRIDRDTSGVILFAKTAAAKDALDRAFRDGAIEKTYLAIVSDQPRGPLGTVKTFIADLGDRARSSRTPIPNGKTAITDWRVRERYARGALIEAKPRTGRFNQIRLHCVDLGCPIAGERKYAVASRMRVKAKRVMLHASRLVVPHPTTGAKLEITAPPPQDFEELRHSLASERGSTPPRAFTPRTAESGRRSPPKRKR